MMPLYLLLTVLLVPLNLWSAVAPHLHVGISLPLLQALTALTLLPGLIDLISDARRPAPGEKRQPLLLLTALSLPLILTNLSGALQGASLEHGWIQHLLSALALASLPIFYLGRPSDQTLLTRLQRWSNANRTNRSAQ